MVKGLVNSTSPFIFSHNLHSILWRKENKDMKKELIKNKIFALGMIAGGITILIASKDATILLLTVLFGVPLFVAKRNYID